MINRTALNRIDPDVLNVFADIASGIDGDEANRRDQLRHGFAFACAEVALDRALRQRGLTMIHLHAFEHSVSFVESGELGVAIREDVLADEGESKALAEQVRQEACRLAAAGLALPAEALLGVISLEIDDGAKA